MRLIAGLVVALGLVAAAPAMAQSDLSALRGKANMPVTMTIERASLADALSMLADAADIEIQVEPDAVAMLPLTAKFLNSRLGEVLGFLADQHKLQATVLGPGIVLVSAPEPASLGALQPRPAATRLRFEILKNQKTIAQPMLAIAPGATGAVSVPGVALISVTPSRLDDKRLALAFEVNSGSAAINPQLVLGNDEPGYISWKSVSGADTFQLRVFRMR